MRGSRPIFLPWHTTHWNSPRSFHVHCAQGILKKKKIKCKERSVKASQTKSGGISYGYDLINLLIFIKKIAK